MIFAPNFPGMRLLAKTLLTAVLLLLGALCVHLFAFSTAGTDTDVDYQRQFSERYRIFSLSLPSDLTFCGEPVPMGKIDVRERLDRELLVNTYWQSNGVLAHKRAHRWFPVIEPILKREGVPDDLKYIALIESGLANVVSPMGATGYWQFMKETGASYGLEINAEVDERYNVERSTRAACAYLKASYAKYGSWAMAAASYNLGPGGLDKQVGRQKSSDYFNLLLPEETSRYVFRILAMKAIITDPERYGFHLREKDLYPIYRTREVSVNGPIADLNDFAAGEGTDYKTLKLLNPWLRDIALANTKGKTYTVLLPGDGFDTPVEDDDR